MRTIEARQSTQQAASPAPTTVAVPAQPPVADTGNTGNTGTGDNNTTEQINPLMQAAVDNIARIPTTSQVQYTPSEETTQAKQNRDMNMKQIVEYLQHEVDTNQEPDEKAKAKQRRREKAKLWMSALADGISAIANMTAQAKGGFNQYDANSGLTKKWEEHYKNMLDKRKKQNEARYSAIQSLYGINDNQYKEAAQHDKDNADFNLKQEKANRENATKKAELLIQADEALRKGELDKYDALLKAAQANKARVEAQWAPRVNQAKVNSYNAAANNSNASAKEHGARTAQIQQNADNSHVITVHDGSTGQTTDFKVKKNKWTRANVGKLYWILTGRQPYTEAIDGKRTYRSMSDMETEIGSRLMVRPNGQTSKNVQNALIYLNSLTQ